MDLPDFESQPLTRSEYLQTVIHLYRGEMQRASTWRSRLDTTTNWAILAVISAISFTFSDMRHPNVILIVSNFIVFMLLWVEARRYRFYDVYRTRLRKIEENFFAPILRRDLQSPEAKWGGIVAEDFLHPRFKIRFVHALKARLIRNYLALFLILFCSWLIKLLAVASAGKTSWDWSDVYAAMGFHVLPPVLILVIQTLFLGSLGAIILCVRIPHAYSGEIHEITADKSFWDR